MKSLDYDVVVIGGGAAGLSAAVALGRARRSVVVLDDTTPRNATATHVHNFLTRDGTPPAELYALGRDEARRYGADLRPRRAVDAERIDDGFVVRLEDGTSVTGRRLLVTTGVVDELPDVAGLRPLWGRDVLHCPYCHGWEVRDRRIGVLATSPFAAHAALLWSQWSDDVTLLLHGGPDIDPDELALAEAVGVKVVPGQVTALDTEDGRLSRARLADGSTVDLDALVVQSFTVARSEVLTSLGVATTELQMGETVFGRYVPADPSGMTDVPGVWVAGNVANLMEVVIGAAASGLKAASVINFDLVAEDARHARETLAGVAAPI
jgi:thioredoxin reductase